MSHKNMFLNGLERLYDLFVQDRYHVYNQIQSKDQYRHNYQFKTDWFSQHIPVWKSKLKDLTENENLRYLEVGVFEGRSFLWVLDNLLTGKGAEAIGIDVRLEHRLLKNLDLTTEREKVTIVEGNSALVLPELYGKRFQLIYIDGAHGDEEVFRDAHLCWPLLDQTGVMIFDDYRFDDGIKKPKSGIDKFLAEHEGQFEVLHSDYQLMIKRN